MSVFEEIAAAAGGVNASATPSVVRVGRHGGRGAGVVIGEGSVLTSAHNLRGNEVTITFADGRSERGEVSAVDTEGDLAVVSVDTGSAAPLAWIDEPEGDPRSVRWCSRSARYPVSGAIE